LAILVTDNSSVLKTSSNSILSLITENSISQSLKKASIKVTLFHLFYFYFLCLFSTLGTVTHPKPSLFLKFKVVSVWLSMTYGGGGGGRGPKSLLLNDLGHGLLKLFYLKKKHFMLDLPRSRGIMVVRSRVH
jgi:hypothetical protein